jgi:indole-3-glycerol phosphate synthase
MHGSVEEIARSYVLGGAAALSVLTEEDYFRGRLDDLRTVRDVVSIPVLRKDFIFEDYQVYESAEAGADALLLIVALLDDQLLKQLLAMTEDELGMDALVEVHTREELRRATQAGAHLIGVNNRDLRSFDVSLDVSLDLAEQAQSQATLISESGLRTATDLKRLRLAGYRGFLIGEALVGSQDPAQALRELITLAEN